MADDLNLTASRLATWHRCRRQHRYQYEERLRPLGTTPKHYHTGRLVHAGLEAGLVGQDPLWALALTEAQAREEAYQSYLRLTGAPWSADEVESLDVQRDLAGGMLLHYALHYGDPTGGLLDGHRLLGVEVGFRVPLLIGAPTVNFAGTFDLISESADGTVYVTDHKTFAGGAPDAAHVRQSPQFRGYVWAARELFPGRPVVLRWNGLRKKVPSMPAVLKSGQLSASARIDTTAAFYRAALAAHQISPTHPKYAGVLAKLEGKGNTFFARHEVHYDRHELASWAAHARADAREIADPATPRTPHWPWYSCERDPMHYCGSGGCSGKAACPYLALCDAEERGEDADYLRATLYTTDPDPGYATPQRLKQAPTVVTCPADVAEPPTTALTRTHATDAHEDW